MALSDYRIDYLEQALADRYRFVRLLGEGGFAAVYQVTHVHLGRTEALKVLLRDHRDEPEFARRFEQEARVAATLDHPNIVRVHDFGEANGIFWYSMQYVEGTTLARILNRGPMPVEEAVTILLPIVDALEFCHRSGVVHRDVKPENVLLDMDGIPHLMDFGIAKSADDTQRTRTGLWVGTPAYVAPEQLAGEPVDGRADVYSVGVMLYEMASGACPNPADNVAKTLLARLRDDAPPLSLAVPGIDPAFEALVMRSLARDPVQRPASAAALWKELAPLIPAETLDAGPDPRTTWAVRAAARPRAAPPPEVEGGTGGAPPAMSRTLIGELVSHRRSMVSVGVLGGAAAAVLLVLSVLLTRESASVTAPPAARAVSTPSAETPKPAIASVIAPPAERPDAPPSPIQHEHETPRRPSAPERPPSSSPTAAPEAPPRRPVRAPQPVVQTPPDIGPELAARCGGGFSQVTLTIGADGHVARGRMLARAPTDCDRAALAAALTWTFTPAADASGQPIEATYAFAVPLPEK